MGGKPCWQDLPFTEGLYVANTYQQRWIDRRLHVCHAQVEMMCFSIAIFDLLSFFVGLVFFVFNFENLTIHGSFHLK